MTHTLYSCRSPAPGSNFYAITKFTADLEVEASYSVGATVCDCPAGHRPSCRHRDMLRDYFLHRGHINDGWFRWETKMWVKPVSFEEPQVENTTVFLGDVLRQQGLEPAFDNELAQSVAATAPAAGEGSVARPSPAAPLRRRV